MEYHFSRGILKNFMIDRFVDLIIGNFIFYVEEIFANLV